MKKILALFLSAVMLFALTACVQMQPGEDDHTIIDPSKWGGHLNMASGLLSDQLDPSSVDANDWADLVWESPLSRNADGSVAPGVCEFELSEDQLTLKLWVREGVTFHDGSPVEIEDVVASMLRRGTTMVGHYVVDYLVEEPTVDENGVATFQFREFSKKTMGYIASVRPLIAVLPKEYVAFYPGYTGSSKAVYNENVFQAIGTGPYKVVGMQDGQWLDLERYEGYVIGDGNLTGAAAPKRAYFDTIRFWKIANATAGVGSLLAGDIDAMQVNLNSYYCDQEKRKNLGETALQGDTTLFLMFDTTSQKNQVHDDVNLRKAICAAIDFPQLNKFAWFNGYSLGGSPCLDAAYYNDAWDTADYMGPANVELAKEYLSKSHYKAGDKLCYFDYDASLAALLEGYLNAAGIEMEIILLDPEVSDSSDITGWDFAFGRLNAGNSPSDISANAYNKAWVNQEKDVLYETLCSTEPGSAEYMTAWNAMADLFVGECVTVYVGTEIQWWSHHKDLVINYNGKQVYLWNSYWKNLEGHGK